MGDNLLLNNFFALISVRLTHEAEHGVAIVAGANAGENFTRVVR